MDDKSSEKSSKHDDAIQKEKFVFSPIGAKSKRTPKPT